MQFMLIFTCLVGWFASVLAANLPYPLVSPQFNGILGGHEVFLNGNIQQMMAQMHALHPSFDPETVKKPLTSRAASGTPGGHLCCPVAGQDWTYAQAWAVSDGVSYLNGIDTISYAARSYGQISCSYASAIVVYNDKYFTINMPGSNPAGYANSCTDDCSEFPQFANKLTCGQQFDDDSWNTIVLEEVCN